MIETPTRAPKGLSLADLFRLYGENFPAGAKAETTMQTEGHHKAHLLRILTPDLEVASLALAHVQEYANRRSREA